MSDTPGISRRGFTRICASALSMFSVSSLFAARADANTRNYERVALVDASNEPLTSSTLATGQSYVFHYPYATTPCFLIDLNKTIESNTKLKTEDGKAYQAPAGVGPNKSVVAFSAICAHRMSHPTRAVSFINYRHKPANFVDKESNSTQQGQVIFCCSEKSVYDAAEGGRVLSGPAPQPLATIMLEHDEKEGRFYATGTAGGEMFERFFEKHDFRLALEYGIDDVRKQVTEKTEAVPIEEYCRNQIMC